MENEEKVVQEETVEETVETPEEKVEEKTEAEILAEEIATLKDKHLRTVAEFENFKKRTAKEKEDFYAYSVCSTVEKFLPVKDNLERAVAAEGAEGSLAEGVKMILKQLDDVLSALGVEKIETVGKEFDPELHNAVMHEENDAFGENTVSEELMSGFICKGKIVRHAMVKVAN